MIFDFVNMDMVKTLDCGLLPGLTSGFKKYVYVNISIMHEMSSDSQAVFFCCFFLTQNIMLTSASMLHNSISLSECKLQTLPLCLLALPQTYNHKSMIANNALILLICWCRCLLSLSELIC